MGIIVLTGLAVFALIGATFMFVKSEDRSNDALMSRISDIEAAIVRLDKSSAKNADMAEMEDSIFKLESELSKAKEVIDVYRQAQKNHSPIEIDQKKPFYVHIVNQKPTEKPKAKKR